MRIALAWTLAALLIGSAIAPTGVSAVHAAETADDDKPFTFQARQRVEIPEGSGRYQPSFQNLEWAPERTALVICDMWDQHWCPGATRRVAEMAPRMNRFISAARQRGALIIHCPSSCMDYYEGTPQRELAKQAPEVEPEVPLKGWCHRDEQREAPLPIDDSDGGCAHDDVEDQRVWTKQIDAIDIKQGDAITDSAEAYYLMRQKGIENVLVMGVHTNMCVLGRPFSIRQLSYQGLNVALVRDLTDTMYDPKMPPKVSHFTGTDYVVEHIEKYWAPTITSDQLLGGTPFRFKNDDRKRLVIVTAEREYETEKTLPPFAHRHLGRDFKVSYVHSRPKEGRHDLEGTAESLKTADVILLSVRRRAPLKKQMRAIRQHVEAGKPVVGIRTTSHAFSLRGDPPPEGHATWEKFDPEVIGGNYHGHYGGGTSRVDTAENATDHPILTGVDTPFTTHGSLYESAPLEDGTTPLLTGTFKDNPAEPVAWTHTTSTGGRVFYTSLGHPKDFIVAPFRRLLINGVYWAAGLSSEKAAQAAGR